MAFIKPHQARQVMAVASLVGIFASGYLLYTYLTGAPIVCGISSGCDIVRLSRWAYTFGLPRPLLGVIFYAAVFGLLVARVATPQHQRWLYRLTMVAAVLGFIESSFLFLVQWLDIKAFCLWCLSSAVAATLLAMVAPFDHPEERHALSACRELRRYFFFLLIFLPIAFIGFVLLTRQRPVLPQAPFLTLSQTAQQPAAAVSSASLVRDNTPVQSGADARLLVAAFIDPACDQCDAQLAALTKIRSHFSRYLRFALRPLPSTKAQSILAAKAMLCAGTQDKYFEFADVLLVNRNDVSRTGLWRRAAGIGLNPARFLSCLDDPRTQAALDQEIVDAEALGISQAPALLTQSQMFVANFQYAEVANAFNQELWVKKVGANDF